VGELYNGSSGSGGSGGGASLVLKVVVASTANQGFAGGSSASLLKQEQVVVEVLVKSHLQLGLVAMVGWDSIFIITNALKLLCECVWVKCSYAQVRWSIGSA